MAKDKFLIAPIKDGLRTDLKPWLLPESAFQRLNNAYMINGSIKKRFGSIFTGSGAASEVLRPLYSRLRIGLTGGAGVGITDGAGAANGIVPGSVFKIGQQFSIGTEIFTVYQLGAPANMLHTGAATTFTYNTTTGAYVFNGAPATTQIYFYPAEPVMGLSNFETDVLNNRPSIAFDTEFAYQYAGGFWDRVGPTAGQQFHGGNADFFHTTNWRGATSDVNLMFITNFNATVPAAATDDPMWRYTGAGMGGWTTFQPIFIVGANFVRSAKLIIPFKDHLLLLNTIENDAGGGLGVNTAHPNRCRFSHNASPIAASAYYERNQLGYTGGGWIDATTREEIVGAEYIRDRLIVYFERSTWELAYTGNKVQPFLWQKINTELGSESTFSSVPFDKAVLTVGTTGIHACSGANVERVDKEIPDQIFKIRNDNSGPIRVGGVRDFHTEMVYWTFPSSDSGKHATTYPNKVLVYNYKDGVWAINDDAITVFGYFEQQTGTTWASVGLTWAEAQFAWDSGTLIAQFKKIIAGNQQGFVFKIEPDVTTNERVLQITNATAAGVDLVLLDIIDHNLATGDYIKITNCQGNADLNDKIYQVTANSNTQIQVTDADYSLVDIYTGGGIAARVSRIDILTKRYNPYIDKSMNISIDSVDFAVQRTEIGEMAIDYYTSSSNVSMADQALNTGALLGAMILETFAYVTIPLEATQELLWHRVYLGGSGESVQLRIYLDDTQMVDDDAISSGFELEGFILNVSPKGRL